MRGLIAPNALALIILALSVLADLALTAPVPAGQSSKHSLLCFNPFLRDMGVLHIDRLHATAGKTAHYQEDQFHV